MLTQYLLVVAIVQHLDLRHLSLIQVQKVLLLDIKLFILTLLVEEILHLAVLLSIVTQ